MLQTLLWMCGICLPVFLVLLIRTIIGAFGASRVAMMKKDTVIESSIAVEYEIMVGTGDKCRPVWWVVITFSASSVNGVPDATVMYTS